MQTRHIKARFPAIGNATQRNVPYHNTTQHAAMHRCAQSRNSVTQRNASAVTALRKHPQANRNEFYFFPFAARMTANQRSRQQ